MSVFGGKSGKKDGKKDRARQEKEQEEKRKMNDRLAKERQRKAGEERKKADNQRKKEEEERARYEEKQRKKEEKERKEAEKRRKKEEKERDRNAEKEREKQEKEEAKAAKAHLKEGEKKGKKEDKVKHDEKEELKQGKAKKKEGAEETKKEEKKEPEAGEAEETPEKKRRRRLRVKIIPRFYIKWVEKQIKFAGSARNPASLGRNIIILSLIISLAAGMLMRRYMMYITPGVFILMFGFLNLLIILSVDRRGRFVDEILPDALLLVSANIRAGYIPSRALLLSARKEFGPLADAIRRSGKEIMSGKSLEEGLLEIPKTIRSDDLKRTIDLIVQGIKGGGQIVTLLEENAIDIRRRQAIKKEIKANTMMYAIFIAFAGCLGAPGLYALSTYLAVTMSELTPDMSMTEALSAKVSFFKMGGINISEQFLLQFSIAAIVLTTFFGGLILGLIGSGREKDGLKFAPILIVIALFVFLGARFVINTMFSGMLPG